ncbi:hypothetical protein [Methylocystis sp. SC2]|uniref:hypothetical protein n=1 Tax=Methylocystis sp. (strain SC2) TaxID=187303 RepID=UPI0011D1A5D5|nr:hypothetical protein [Methylocystis sp. SC2]
MESFLASFFEKVPESCGPIYNERSLQLELACLFRAQGAQVEFERPFVIAPLEGSTCPVKSNLDLLIRNNGQTTAIELKVPLNGRHPETLYDFCNDIAFVEGILRAGHADTGICVMLTSDRVFWSDSGRGSAIHNLFRRKGSLLNGAIQKPTGAANTTVFVCGKYYPADRWVAVRDTRLMGDDAKYLAIEIKP